MIYSYEHKFVFIKGKKVAGTSVEIALSAICGEKDIITPITQIDERIRVRQGGRQPQNFGGNPVELDAYNKAMREAPEASLSEYDAPKGEFSNHMPLKKVIRLLGAIPADFVVFGIDRSPYAKVISVANMILSRRNYNATGERMVAPAEKISEMVDTLIANGTLDRVFNLPRYLDEKGELATRIIKFENLRDGLHDLLVERGVSNPPELPHAKQGIGTESVDYRQILRPAHIETINKVFAREFEAFGYPVLQ